jgi:hypothetical protein
MKLSYVNKIFKYVTFDNFTMFILVVVLYNYVCKHSFFSDMVPVPEDSSDSPSKYLTVKLFRLTYSSNPVEIISGVLQM